jgi:hypothetical protein
MISSPQNHPSRRTVLKSIGATTALSASGLLPSTIYAVPSASANDKLRVGLIGAGNRRVARVLRGATERPNKTQLLIELDRRADIARPQDRVDSIDAGSQSSYPYSLAKESM